MVGFGWECVSDRFLLNALFWEWKMFISAAQKTSQVTAVYNYVNLHVFMIEMLKQASQSDELMNQIVCQLTNRSTNQNRTAV